MGATPVDDFSARQTFPPNIGVFFFGKGAAAACVAKLLYQYVCCLYSFMLPVFVRVFVLVANKMVCLVLSWWVKCLAYVLPQKIACWPHHKCAGEVDIGTSND